VVRIDQGEAMVKRAAVVVALMALASCGGSKVDTDTVEKSITSNLKADLAVDATVECPDDITWETGKTFTCTIEGVKGMSGATVSMKNDDGGYSYKIDSAPE
jgi:hypothetical protein